MPKLWPVTALGFPNLFVELGIQAIPAGPQFFLHDTIIPVSLVNSQITLAAEAVPVLYDRSQIFDVAAVAPAANDVLADTGALTVGDYDLKLMLTVGAALADQRVLFSHRNAGNTGDIWSQIAVVTDPGTPMIWNTDMSITILANERFRFIVLDAFGAGERISSVIMAKRRT